jgi:putative hydrolase of the HAD superfamily
MNQKIKLIIIDLYGVISRGSYRDVCRYIARKYNIPFKHVYSVVYHKYFSAAALGKMSEADSFRLAIKELGLPINWKVVRKLHYINIIRVNKSSLNFCIGLQKQGYTILLLSKNTTPQFNYTVKNLNLRRYFKHIINTLDLGLPKASKQTMLWVCKKFNVKPAEIIFVDDQDFNLPEAKKLGVKTVQYKNFEQFRKEIRKHL